VTWIHSNQYLEICLQRSDNLVVYHKKLRGPRPPGRRRLVHLRVYNPRDGLALVRLYGDQLYSGLVRVNVLVHVLKIRSVRNPEIVPISGYCVLKTVERIFSHHFLS
jgi:hypothetical protein